MSEGSPILSAVCLYISDRSCSTDG